jgi:hypothetical protein
MKKNYYPSLSFLSITLLLLLTSFVNGPGPTIRENSFKINGDGFKDQFIQIEIRANEFMSNYYGRGIYNYFQEAQNMSVKISGGNKVSQTSPITGLHIDFNKFRGTGIYTLDSSISFSLFFKKDIPTSGYDNQYMLDSDGEINIKTYEPVGGLIEGTFSGKFNKVIFDKQTGAFVDSDILVTITEGKFSVIHCPDYHWDTPQSTGKEPAGFNDKKKKAKKGKS